MSDPIRARLDEHHMFRGHCIGCVRRFGGPQFECLIQLELDALRAVLDLCDKRTTDGVTYLLIPSVRAVIAAALEITEEAR